VEGLPTSVDSDSEAVELEHLAVALGADTVTLVDDDMTLGQVSMLWVHWLGNREQLLDDLAGRCTSQSIDALLPDVRIDVIVGKFSKRTQVWIDVFGFTFFLLPTTLLILYFATPYAIESLRNQEVSSNAGGLIVWPAKLLIPVGFFLLTLQGFSELIKRLGYLMGKVELSAFEKQTVTPEDEIQAIKAANQL
jgi:hypothetical protein